KAANVNYIRTSHYPPSEEFIEWCDKIGLYVELENPLSWVGHGANAHWKKNNPHNPEFYPYLENISNANVSFFRNHPSIIIWSMVNESAWGPNWAKLAKFYAKKDPARPATFHDQAYGGFNNYGSTSMPIANIHYPGTKGPSIAEDFLRPLLFGEFAHLNTYNRTEIVTDPGVRDAWGRGFKKMWEGMYKSRGCLGGAIWSGIDDVFYLPDGRAVGYGEWGPIDGWRREKPEYFHMKKSYSPVKIHNRNVTSSEPGNGISLQIENRFDFTNLSECKIIWKLEQETGQIEIDLAPHQFGILNIYPKSENLEGKLLTVKIFSPQDIEVESCVIEIGEVKRETFPFVKAKSKELKVSEKSNILTVKGDSFTWNFDLNKGKLEGAQIGKSKVITKGAELMILSLTTGSCDTEHNLQIPFHNSTCNNWVAKSTRWKEQNDTIIVTVDGNYTEAEGNITYKFANNGTLTVSYDMLSKIKVNPRQWGMVFTVPSEVKNLSWYRKGLWSYYPENHIGRTTGSAIPFDSKAFHLEAFGQKPVNDWRFDANSLGTNDFRATRENIYWAALTNKSGAGLTIVSDGRHAFRSFADGGTIRFLVADYSTGGGDLFFSGHYNDERKKLEEGSKIKGLFKVQLVKTNK
ncbi:MAG: glycoside hydrolase family 2 TIM barrel-domain containing protein, partial [Bacteroidota bacterium]